MLLYRVVHNIFRYTCIEPFMGDQCVRQTDGQNDMRRPIGHYCNAVVTCEIELFQNYFSLCGRPPEIVLFQRVETCPKLFQNYFCSS